MIAVIRDFLMDAAPWKVPKTQSLLSLNPPAAIEFNSCPHHGQQEVNHDTHRDVVLASKER